LVFHGNGDSLEHDFIVAPGAQPSRISFRFDKPVHVTPDGNLLVDLGDTTLYFRRPAAYQRSGTYRKDVPVRFSIMRNGDVRFKLGRYDHSKALVIDPVFGFSTYLDGSNADSITAVTTDSTGNIYVTGFTASTDFPITNANNPLCAQCTDAGQTSEAFISKLDPTGHSLLFSTYLGGSTSGGPFGTFASAIVLDHLNNIVVAGVSSSWDFPHAGAVLPLTPQFYNSSYYFVSSLMPDGSAFNYSGLVGGQQGSYTNGNNGKLAVDPAGYAYLTGTEDDANFQLTSGVFGPTEIGKGFDTMFVMKFDPTGRLVYSTLVPGTLPQDPAKVTQNSFLATGIVVDSMGRVTLAGNGGPGLPVTPGALLSAIPNAATFADPSAGLLIQLNPTASALNFSTYLPGADLAGGLAVDSAGNFYVAGLTSQTTLPVGPNSYQKTIVPNSNCTCDAGYVMKIDPSAKTVLAATYLSGSSGATFRGVAVDSGSNVLVGGLAFASDFPLKNPFTTALQTSSIAAGTVLAELDTNLMALQFGSYLSSTSYYGGSIFGAITFDSHDKAIVVGTTLATDFPTTTGSYQITPPPPSNPLVGYQHSFISKLDLATPAPSVCLDPNPVNIGTVTVGISGSATLNIHNCGNATLQASSISSTVSSVVPGNNCASIAAGNTCALTLTFTPVDNSPVSGRLTLTDNAAIPTQVVSFSAKGGIPQVSFPSSITSNDLLVGTQAPFYYTFINTGDGEWLISNVTVTDDFSLHANCTSPILPGGANSFCQLALTFAPSQVGTRIGTLTITDNVAGSPHVIQLSGSGLSSYPSPTVASVMAVPTDAKDPQLLLIGANFFPASQVSVNGSTRTTVYGAENFMTAALNANDIGQMGELQVTVATPTPGGGQSSVYPAAVYSALRNIAILHSVFEPVSGLLYSSVASTSAMHANQIIAVDPVSATVTKSWSVGNGPNQLAVSDDGQFLYVGLDTDKKVAQISLPSGKINFAVAIGNDSDFNNPMVADAIRVLPGHPHAWSVTLCGVGFAPCGEGVAVFDDNVQRPTRVNQSQLQPDSLLFVGSDASHLYGTTLQQIPSTFYRFSITASGVTETQSVTNYASTSPGGGFLDTDGTSIFVSNGQVINPADLTIESTLTVPAFSSSFRVDAAAGRIYFAGAGPNSGLSGKSALDAIGLSNSGILGQIPMNEFFPQSEIFRWGANGLAIGSTNGMLLFRTSLTGKATAQIAVSGTTTNTVGAGQSANYNLTVAAMNGFTGPVTLGCTNLPAYASCSFSPASLNLTAAAATVAVTISTVQQQSAGVQSGTGEVLAGIPWLLALALAPFSFRFKDRGRRSQFLMPLAILALIIWPLAGCGGGATTVKPPLPITLETPKGTYTVNFVVSGAGVSNTTSLALVVQ
jgi:hypothetical protein